MDLSDGRVLVAADGADEVEPSPDGKSLRALWRRWTVVGGKAGQLEDPRVTSEVVWRIEDQTLTREESLKSTEDLTLRRWWVALPTTAARNEILFDNGQRRDRCTAGSGALEMSASAGSRRWVPRWATGSGAPSRGAPGPVPLHPV